MKPALLVIDMQRKFAREIPGAEVPMKSAIEYIAWALEVFTKRGLPIFHVVHSDEGTDGPFGEDFWEFDEIAAADRKDVIVKTKGSAFVGTDLEARLRAAGADCVVVTGFCAEYCVLSTARGAEDLGWNPMILRGAIASDDAEAISFVERKNDCVSPGALSALLG